jgi:hypothetical protein
MQLSELEANLRTARVRLDETSTSNALPEARLAAREALLHAERALSLAQGQETALPCEWEAPWETGAPLPHVLSSGWRTFLLYVAHEPDPDWDGSYVREMRTMDIHRIALVEFRQCSVYQFGVPNDEVIGGHRLWGKGLAPYAAHVIANSRWLAEMEQINKVHPSYQPDKWRALKHYLLIFHDESFECLASSYTIEVMQDTLEHGAEIARTRLFP